MSERKALSVIALVVVITTALGIYISTRSGGTGPAECVGPSIVLLKKGSWACREVRRASDGSDYLRECGCPPQTRAPASAPPPDTTPLVQDTCWIADGNGSMSPYPCGSHVDRREAE